MTIQNINLNDIQHDILDNNNISLFKNTFSVEKLGTIPLRHFLISIQDGTYDSTVFKARELYKTNLDDYNDFKKTSVRGVTLSAHCKNRKKESFIDRKKSDKLIKHSGILQIDIDNIDDIDGLKKILNNDQYTLFSFTSISGHGIKIGIMIDGTQHEKFAVQAQTYYKKAFNIDIDKSCKDLFRLCFISHDPELFFNPNAKLFNVEYSTSPVKYSNGDVLPNYNLNKLITDLPKSFNLDEFKIQTQETERAMSICYKLLDNSIIGIDRHPTRYKVGRLLGGWVAGGFFSKEFAMNSIRNGVQRNTTMNIDKAMKTISDGIDGGMDRPFHLSDIIEKRKLYLEGKFKNNDFNDYLKNTMNEYVYNVQEDIDTIYPQIFEQNNFTPDEAINEETIRANRPNTLNQKIFDFTDLGNGQRFIRHCGHIIRYNYDTQNWHVWNGKAWEIDRKEFIYIKAEEVTALIPMELNYSTDSQIRKEIVKHHKNSSNRAKQKAMIETARNEPDIKCLNNNFDDIQHLFNLNNGIFDFKSMKIINHDRKLMLSKISNVNYNSEAICPKFEEALNLWFDNDIELIHFVQKCCSLSLVAEHYEEAFFFAYGNGKNGKSIFFNIMEKIFGDYYQTAPADMLIQQRQEKSIPNDIAGLPGARFVVCEELPENRTLDEAKIKRITGGDKIKARHLYKEYFEFKASCQLWLMGNHKPQIKGTDEGIWRRVYMIPFTVTIPEVKRINHNELMKIFDTELSGIFNWIVKGFEYYQLEKGLNPPDIVKVENDKYRYENDKYLDFLNDYCLMNENEKIEAKILYNAYVEYCKNYGDILQSKVKFFNRISQLKNVQKMHGTKNVVIFQGITTHEEFSKKTELY